MTPGLREALAALPARQLNLMAIGAVGVALALAWSVGLRAPLAAHAKQRKALATLEARATASTPPVAAPAPTAASGDPVATPVAAPPPPAPLALIAAVSRSAAHAGVTVSSAAQGAGQQVAGLRLHTVDISASGSYAAILAWLADIEASQPTVGIVRLALSADDADDRRRIALQLAIYDTERTP